MVAMDALTWVYVVVGVLLVGVVIAMARRNARHSPTTVIKGGPGSGGQSEPGAGGGVPMPDHRPPRTTRHDQDRW